MALSLNWCILCEGDSKSTSRLFIHCNFSKAIWNYFFGSLFRSWVMPEEVLDLIWQWNSWGMGIKGRIFWHCLLHGVSWGRYMEGKERNWRTFEGKSRSCKEVADLILKEVGSWILITKEFKDFQPALFQRDWITSVSVHKPKEMKAILPWNPPIMGSWKLNFDGASKGNLYRDCNSKVILAVCGPMRACNSIEG